MCVCPFLHSLLLILNKFLSLSCVFGKNEVGTQARTRVCVFQQMKLPQSQTANITAGLKSCKLLEAAMFGTQQNVGPNSIIMQRQPVGGVTSHMLHKKNVTSCD